MGIPRNHPFKDLFALQNSLRSFAVWKHELDGQTDEEHRIPYPRFLAVIEDEKQFQRLRKTAEDLQARFIERNFTVRWFPTFFDESWTDATVRVLGAYTAKIHHEGGRLPLRTVGVAQKAQYLEHVEKALAEFMALHPYFKGTIKSQVVQGKLLSELEFSTKRPLTVRRDTGRKFRMYGRISGGGHRTGVKVGAVVVRALEGKVFEDLPRAQRKDTKQAILTLEPYSFYQV